MRGPIAYLDSSSIVKRYVEEPGSDTIRGLYLKAYSAELIISFNSWNIGEVLGAFDKALTRGNLSQEDYLKARKRLLLETRRLIRLEALRLIPLRLKLLIKCWSLLEKYHIYQADALQIVSAKIIGATQFFTGDKKLHEIANKEGLNSTLTT